MPRLVFVVGGSSSLKIACDHTRYVSLGDTSPVSEQERRRRTPGRGRRPMGWGVLTVPRSQRMMGHSIGRFACAEGLWPSEFCQAQPCPRLGLLGRSSNSSSKQPPRRLGLAGRRLSGLSGCSVRCNRLKLSGCFALTERT